ncbi:MAG: site-specific DNA-methyltransferase [Phycisphaerae bacterium]
MTFTFDEIKKCLGKPFYETTDCMIFCAECLEMMAKLTCPLIDLTVTSPPYNIGKEYEKQMPIEEYIEWCMSWIMEIHRVTKPNGSLWVNVGYLEIPGKAKALPIPYLLWDKTPFYLIQEIVWNYGAGVAGKKFFSPRNEKFLWYVKDSFNFTYNLDEIRDKNVKYPHQKKNGKLKCNPLGKNPTDVWYIPKVTSGKNRSSRERTAHPAQFPFALIERVVKASSNKNDLILDPFLGSGTAAVVALANERKFIGFEIQERYCEIAAKRITKYMEKVNEPTLFSLVQNV